MPDSSMPVSGEPESNPQTAVAMQPSFDDLVARLHKKAETVSKAEEAFKRAFVPFCEELYAFGKSHSLETIINWLSAKGLRVTAAANGWTPAVKLAFAVENNGKWLVNDQQVSKYTKIMEYAERENIAVGHVEAWIGSNSFTDMLFAARHNGNTSKRLDEAIIKQKIIEQSAILKKNWGPLLDGKTFEPLDMTRAPISKGYVQIFAEISDTGEVSLIGMEQADPSKFLKLITPPPASMLDTGKLRGVSGVKELLRFGSFIPASSGHKGKITRSVVLLVKKDKWLFHAFKHPGQSSPLAVVNIPGSQGDIPEGAWLLTTHEQATITSLLTNFPPEMLECAKNKNGELVLKLVDGTKTVQDYIDEINAVKKQKWLEKTKRGGEKPPVFELPKPINNNTREMRIKNAAEEKIPQIGSVDLTEFELTFSRGLRNSICEACARMPEAEGTLRMRFTEASATLSSLDDGTKSETVSYGKTVNKGLDQGYVIEKSILVDALNAMTLAVGDGPCKLFFGRTMFGFMGERDGITFEVYLPQIEVGERYAPDEFVCAPISMPQT